MTIMDYQLAVLLASTLGLVIYAVIDHIKHGGVHEVTDIPASGRF